MLKFNINLVDVKQKYLVIIELYFFNFLHKMLIFFNPGLH